MKKLVLTIIILFLFTQVEALSIENGSVGKNISFQILAVKTGRKSLVTTVMLCGNKTFIWKNRASKNLSRFLMTAPNTRAKCLILTYGLDTGNYTIINQKAEAKIQRAVITKDKISLLVVGNVDEVSLKNNFGKFKVKVNKSFSQSLRCGRYLLDEKVLYFNQILDDKKIPIRKMCLKINAETIFLTVSVLLNIIFIIKR